MAPVTIVFGAALVLLGIIGYALGLNLPHGASPTALIPAGFGVVLVVLGLLARAEARRKLVMHIAAGLALVGFLATAKAWGGAVTLLGGGTVERPEATVAKSIMALLCVVFLGLAVRSFVAARIARNKVA